MKTTPTVEIEASWKAVGLRLAGGLASTALFIALACHVVPPTNDVLDLMIGGVGTAASVLWTVLAALRFAMLRGPIVTIAQQGIRDRRIAGEMVPWSAVARISTREDTRHKEMVLWVDSGLERRLTRSWWPGLRRDADRHCGGLRVTALGLRTSHETLLATTLAYLEAWRESRRGG